MSPMRSGLLITAAACAALGLSACNNANKRAGSQICTPFPEAATAQPGDLAGALDDCLHRWGYTLAASTDSAEAVAQATVAACGTAVARWNQQGLSTGQGGAQPAAGAPEAPSLLTGQPTNPLAEHYTYAQARALFYVVQARAGKCAPPPATPAGRTAR
jgi:hypothetical protein